MVMAVSAGVYHNQVPLESLASEVKKTYYFNTPQNEVTGSASLVWLDALPKSHPPHPKDIPSE